MRKTKPARNDEMNALLRGARGVVVEVADDEAKKKRKERNSRMNAALRAAARGFTDEDIDNGKVT